MMETRTSASFSDHKLAQVDDLLSCTSYEEFFAFLCKKDAVASDGCSIEDFVQSYLATATRARPSISSNKICQQNRIDERIVTLYILLARMVSSKQSNN